ncbi:hypothetical protein AJ80_03948 [Polytolypa hystricis UAMH7299]|uniref:Uncharacterized protein n=1 Tax=Polytolypa hystricis (strain UAMH7299) TaxID=1447883 RepID=A0A2B7YFR5_POLH7|nr:hypothetical protein AJ80_03948 [Polytolypa hystricis UAMH7299]
MATFLDLYNNPPSGVIQSIATSTTTTRDLTHPLEADSIPNYLVNQPQLAENLVEWARAYLQKNVHHYPPPALVNSQDFISSQFKHSRAGGEGTVVMLYGTIIKPGPKRRRIFDTYYNAIRGLATANGGSGKVLSLGTIGHAEGARSIVIKLGRPMIADGCQLDMLFGGQRFILFAIHEWNDDGVVRRRMLCSRIHRTVTTDGTPSAIQDIDVPCNSGGESIPSPPGGVDSTANLVLYSSTGDGASGSVFEADLQHNGKSQAVVAKGFDSDTIKFGRGVCWENSERAWMFENEFKAYKCLSAYPLIRHCYGAFVGIGHTGLKTGLIILEKLSDTFDAFSEMSLH